MNNRYRKIIREEIDKFILSEAINVASLNSFVRPLNQCSSDISNISSFNNQELDQFLKDLVEYIIQIIFGIERCVKANNLNESLYGYGIEVPPELGGNFYNDFVNGFYKGSNWARKKIGYGNDSEGYNNARGVNRNNVPSVKLVDSLSKLANFAMRYRTLEAKYSNAISNVSQAPLNALTEIGKVQREYNRLNAQGTNP